MNYTPLHLWPEVSLHSIHCFIILYHLTWRIKNLHSDMFIHMKTFFFFEKYRKMGLFYIFSVLVELDNTLLKYLGHLIWKRLCCGNLML